ncbi:hypothetical protein APY03_3920 [Variovorax sp. WDL1]|nr:hypothetical protein APY03_3920 [Variovorax sp. WDL1]
MAGRRTAGDCIMVRRTNGVPSLRSLRNFFLRPRGNPRLPPCPRSSSTARPAPPASRSASGCRRCRRSNS